MRADDAALKDFQAIERVQPRAHPMTDVRRGTDARVAIFHHAEDVIRVPHFIAGVIRTARMIVEAERMSYSFTSFSIASMDSTDSVVMP